MRTYHALYKPKGRKNPRRSRPVRAPVARRNPRSARRRLNPVSSADVALIVTERVEDEIKRSWTNDSNLYEPPALAPAGILFIAPGDDVEYGGRIYKGTKTQWKWVAFTNGGTVISEGKEKDPQKAIVEATASLMTWALALVATTHDRLQKEGKSEEQVKKAMQKWTVREYTPDGSKMPKAGKTKKVKGPGRMTGKIYGEKPKKDQKRAGEVVWYVEVFDDDGKPVGADEGKKKARIGPILDGAAAYGIMNSIWGIAQGEQDVIEANPVQRRRLNSTARRKLARKNDGIWDYIKTPSITTEKGRISAEEAQAMAFDSAVGTPADPYAAQQLGYYRGILRGMATCKWYPDPLGALNRWQFKRELNKRYIEAINRLAEGVAEYEPQVRPIRQVRR